MLHVGDIGSAEAAFNPGDSVTIMVKEIGGSLQTLQESACVEELDGIFTWPTSNLSIQPVVYTKMVWVMTNQEGRKQRGVLEFEDILNRINSKLSLSHGSGSWGALGEIAGINKITLQLYKEGTITPVPNASVKILNSDRTAVLSGGRTDGNGRIARMLDDGIYYIRISDHATVFDEFELIVLGDATNIIYGTDFMVDAPTDPLTCRVYERVVLPDGVNHPEALESVVKVHKLPHDSNGNLVVGSEIAPMYESTTGYLYWDVPQESEMYFHVPLLGVNQWRRLIPKAATYRLTKIPNQG